MILYLKILTMNILFTLLGCYSLLLMCYLIVMITNLLCIVGIKNILLLLILIICVIICFYLMILRLKRLRNYVYKDNKYAEVLFISYFKGFSFASFAPLALLLIYILIKYKISINIFTFLLFILFIIMTLLIITSDKTIDLMYKIHQFYLNVNYVIDNVLVLNKMVFKTSNELNPIESKSFNGVSGINALKTYEFDNFKILRQKVFVGKMSKTFDLTQLPFYFYSLIVLLQLTLQNNIQSFNNVLNTNALRITNTFLLKQILINYSCIFKDHVLITVFNLLKVKKCQRHSLKIVTLRKFVMYYSSITSKRGRPRINLVINNTNIIKRSRGRPRKMAGFITKFIPKPIVVYKKVKKSVGISLLASVIILQAPQNPYSDLKSLNFINYMECEILLMYPSEGIVTQVVINNLSFLISKERFELEFDAILSKLTITEIYESISKSLRQIKFINSAGFITTIDLNDQSYYIINKFVNYFVISLPKEIIRDGQRKIIYSQNPAYIDGVHSKDTYRWIYCLLMLNYYTLINMLIKNIETNVNQDLLDDDMFENVKNLRDELHDSLEPSVRRHLQKRGLSIIQNIQTGFDTEYVNVDSMTNKLLSVQLAVNTITYLKTPRRTSYVASGVNTHTDEKYIEPKTPYLAYDMIESAIEKCVSLVRVAKYGDMDFMISQLNNVLSRVPGVENFEGDEHCVFRLPLTETKTFFEEVTNGYSVSKIISVSQKLSGSDIHHSYEIVRDLLKRLLDDLGSSIITGSKINESNISLKLYKDIPINTDTKSLAIFDDENPLENGLKSLSRGRLQLSSGNRLSLTRSINVVLIGHLTPADISIMDDFKEFNEYLDIVNKSFVTLGKAVNYAGARVILRDTMLLAPAGAKSLASIGKLYNYDKLELSSQEYNAMDDLLKTNPEKFISYAIRDAEITLKHANWMEHFNFTLGSVGVPITLSSIGNKFVAHKWQNACYHGYQVIPDILIGDAGKIQTPIGLNKMGDIGFVLNKYIANYKGGRNESFMYGYDDDILVHDYDLTSAYTTVLYNIGHPNYSGLRKLTAKELQKLSDRELLFSYTIIKCEFSKPQGIYLKYPSIPVYVDETTTVYPVEGSAMLTGAEYILARNQGFILKIEECYIIPFLKSVSEEEIPYEEFDENAIPELYYFPFKDIIKEIQSKRREHAKGSIANLMYKEIGNSIYGSLVRGMSDKRRFDNKTKGVIRLQAHTFSNPLLASWITGFIRSIIGECLQGIQDFGGRAVSVTTDGFITNVDDLEKRLTDSNKYFLFNEFRKLRKAISGNSTGLELKHSGRGIISWSTRGQLGIDTNLRATTGFQNRPYSQEELIQTFKEAFKSDHKTMEYVQSSLRSAIEIAKHGGHVTMIFRDIKFNLRYDMRRIINPIRLTVIDDDIDQRENKIKKENKNHADDYIKESELYYMQHGNSASAGLEIDTVREAVTETDNGIKSIDDNIVKTSFENFRGTIYDSSPVPNAKYAENLRYISRRSRVSEYNQRTSAIVGKSKYKNTIGIAIRQFIKIVYSNDSVFTNNYAEFKQHFLPLGYKGLIKFIHDYDTKLTSVNAKSISKLKNRKIIFKQVPRTKETQDFVKYVKTHFPDFNDDLFFRKF